MRHLDNLLLNTDSYKASHWLQYPPHTDATLFYVESRGGTYERTLFFGLQAILKEYLSTPITHTMIDEAKEFFAAHGEPFNEAGWRRIVDVHGGRLPLRIRAVPEGSVVPTHHALVTIESTDPDAFWLPSYLETLLLRLLRGAGVRGLAGMPVRRRLGVGELVRPLLDVSRAELLAYAQAHGLQWVEDPSNQQTQFSRNYLRHAVLPAMTARWPQALRSLARTAGHLAEARELLDERAQEDLAPLSAPDEFSWLKLPSLNLPALKRLSPARQRNALQYWLATRTRLPDSDHWAGWCDLRDASVGASAVWRLTDGELHRGGECIYWLSGAWLEPLAEPEYWSNPLQTLRLPGNGSVSLHGNPPQEPLRIGYRQGGETLEIPGRGRRDLKRLLNERHVPPFVRSRLPLLFAGDRLLAVANLPGLSAGDLRLDWDVPTSEQGLA